MTPEKPDVLVHGIYCQADAARRLGVDRHTLARWEKSLRLVPHHSDGHFKYYLGKDIVNAWRGKR